MTKIGHPVKRNGRCGHPLALRVAPHKARTGAGRAADPGGASDAGPGSSPSWRRSPAGRIDVDVAGGTHYGNWRSGYTNVSADGSSVTSWNQNLPAVGSLVRSNIFTLSGLDVTPSPFNQPPYPASGDTDSDDCTVVGN